MGCGGESDCPLPSLLSINQDLNHNLIKVLRGTSESNMVPVMSIKLEKVFLTKCCSVTLKQLVSEWDTVSTRFRRRNTYLAWIASTHRLVYVISWPIDRVC